MKKEIISNPRLDKFNKNFLYAKKCPNCESSNSTHFLVANGFRFLCNECGVCWFVPDSSLDNF